jgi:hypothetical protein
MDAPIHVERLSDGSKFPGQLRLAERETVFCKTDPHEEGTIMQVSRVLVGLEDVPTMLKDKVRDSRYNSWLVWARNQERNHLTGCLHV